MNKPSVDIQSDSFICSLLKFEFYLSNFEKFYLKIGKK